MRRRQRLSLEFAGCFFLYPVLLMPFSIKGVYVWLWIACLVCVWWLHKHARWNNVKDWKPNTFREELPRIFYRFIPLAIAMLAFTWVYAPLRLFEFPLNNFWGWVGVMIMYPIISVFPQEVLFRSFLHRRYRMLFQSRHEIVLASAITFGWAHIVMHNWIAVVFSFLGGLIFASTYERTRSLSVVCFEHTLYGCWVFTIGLGWYFFHGYNGG
ncbi:MAG: CPBP family intramembrane glutamic endopeptidase [Alphaproteobacteria bacterium]